MTWPDDEDAIDAAVQDMYASCGNNGQTAIIQKGESDYRDWAADALEAEFGYSNYDETIIAAVGQSAWDGTIEIWQQGYEAMSDQSGYHDGYDENGEGTGDEF